MKIELTTDEFRELFKSKKRYKSVINKFPIQKMKEHRDSLSNLPDDIAAPGSNTIMSLDFLADEAGVLIGSPEWVKMNQSKMVKEEDPNKHNRIHGDKVGMDKDVDNRIPVSADCVGFAPNQELEDNAWKRVQDAMVGPDRTHESPVKGYQEIDYPVKDDREIEEGPGNPPEDDTFEWKLEELPKTNPDILGHPEQLKTNDEQESKEN